MGNKTYILVFVFNQIKIIQYPESYPENFPLPNIFLYSTGLYL